MRVVPQIEDELRGYVTYEHDGRYLRVDAKLLLEHGEQEVLNAYGFDAAQQERVPVYQNGRLIGTVPSLFHPRLIRSKSFFYTPRPGDFTWNTDRWIAANSLGPGDLDAIHGFIGEREDES